MKRFEALKAFIEELQTANDQDREAFFQLLARAVPISFDDPDVENALLEVHSFHLPLEVAILHNSAVDQSKQFLCYAIDKLERICLVSADGPTKH